MTEVYDALYLSPHLDDIALSCGGHIWQRTQAGERVLVVTLAAGEPPEEQPLSDFAALLHRQWGLSSGVAAARRREDEAALAMLGAEVIHWSLADCVYRSDPDSGRPYYPSLEAIFGTVDTEEGALIDSLAAKMRALPAAREVLGPLGVGNHVDHQLTRSAAEAAFGQRLLYYEEFPYVGRDRQAVDRLLAERPRWELHIIPLDDTAVARRIAAIAAYTSQIGSLFGAEGAMVAAVKAYITAVGGERLWRPVA